MIRRDHNVFTRFAIVLLVVAAAGVAAGCQSKPCRSGDNSRFRCDPTAASTGTFTAMSSVETGPVAKEMQTIWRSGNQFVHLESQDYVKGGPPLPNSHPVQIPRERIHGALRLIVMQDSPKNDPIPLFTADSL